MGKATHAARLSRGLAPQSHVWRGPRGEAMALRTGCRFVRGWRLVVSLGNLRPALGTHRLQDVDDVTEMNAPGFEPFSAVNSHAAPTAGAQTESIGRVVLPTGAGATVTHTEKWVAEVEQLFRARESGAFFVLARVVRRVWQNELEIASPWVPPPHRKSCVMERDRLLWLVARDELGVDADTPLPQRLILIARPEEDQLLKFSREDLLRYYWRLLFHARIDFELGPKTTLDRMPTSELRRRIDALGQTQFDEIRAVLRAEQMLVRPDDSRLVYAEFVAVWHELRAFAPTLLPLYFPALVDEEAVLRRIGADCNAASLLEATRPHEQSLTAVAPVATPPADVVESLLEDSQLNLTARSPRAYAAYVRRAKRLRLDGNNVRAALVRLQAFDVAPLDQMNDARSELLREIEFLVRRVQAALELTDDEARPWLAMCERLLPAARRGFWNANARLLYDLQQVCLDHEQEIYKVDLLRWAMRLGKDSLKRPLPNQRVVMMSKHLRSAALRVPVVQIDATGRKELSGLLHSAAAAAEHLLRKRMEPLVADALTEAGLVPNGVVERVAFRKVVQELLDGVVQRGFLTLGEMRDAIARNQLKIPDLTDAREFLTGDPLLRADKLLASRIDGVYQRGPFYLQWMQRLNSLAYGTTFGRMLTKFVFLPFGLSFLSLMAVEEIAHLALGPAAPVAAHVMDAHAPAHLPTGTSVVDGADLKPVVVGEPNLNANVAADTKPETTPPIANLPSGDPIQTQPTKTESTNPDPANGSATSDALNEITPASGLAPGADSLPPTAPLAGTTHTAARHHWVYSRLNMFLLGCFIFALIHAPPFRNAVETLLRATWKVLRVALVEVPRYVMAFPPVEWLLKSFPMKLFRRFVIAPVLVTSIFCVVLPWLGVYDWPNRWSSLAVLIVCIAVLNSRFGRDTEELTREFLSRLWYRIRTHLLLGLFTLIVDAFHWLMDGLERVLYAVDEWLRFRSGESTIALAVKAVLGLVWSFVHGVVRFCVTLLIEPQINPIKHFPVVTVSHKMILPWAVHITYLLAAPLTPFLGTVLANAIGPLVVTAIPGVFGFLVWELKENWKLYAANRPRKLRPARIGHHGESLLRLLCPGFHSGTIPKLFARRRRAARMTHQNPNVNKQARYAEKLHHEAESLRHFVDRELIGLLSSSRTFRYRSLSVGHVELATNRVTILLLDRDQPGEPVKIEFDEQSGWLIATVADLGWLRELTDEDRAVFRTALAGLYKLGSVDLVREQIESHLVAPVITAVASPVDDIPDATAPAKVHFAASVPHTPSTHTLSQSNSPLKTHPYDVASNGLVVWPQAHYDAEVHFALDESPTATPRPRSLARAAGLTSLPLAAIVFAEHSLDWAEWHAYWETEQNPTAIPRRLLPEVTLLRQR